MKTSLRNFLGELPLAAELDYTLRQKNRARKDHYNFHRLAKVLAAGWQSRSSLLLERKHLPAKISSSSPRSIIGSNNPPSSPSSLAGLGHKVTLLTLPYSEWHKEMDKLTQRQRVLHTRDALSALSPLVEHVPSWTSSLLPFSRLTLKADVEEISLWDAQYTLMREEVDMANARPIAPCMTCGSSATHLPPSPRLNGCKRTSPDVVLIPNGLILEMGIVFRVARYLNIPAVTYEFNDQREQIWLAQNSSIMRQDTDYLVQARCRLPMTDEMYERVADLENARRGARVWGKSKRLWQYVSSQGAEANAQSARAR